MHACMHACMHAIARARTRAIAIHIYIYIYGFVREQTTICPALSSYALTCALLTGVSRATNLACFRGVSRGVVVSANLRNTCLVILRRETDILRKYLQDFHKNTRRRMTKPRLAKLPKVKMRPLERSTTAQRIHIQAREIP